MHKSILICCLAVVTAYSTPKKEPQMPEIDHIADYGSPVANSWPIGRDPVPEEDDSAAQKQREAAQLKIEAILKAKIAAKKTTPSAPTAHASPIVAHDEPASFNDVRPLGYDLVLKSGDMVKRVQRFLNDYEQSHPDASEEHWMIAFLDEMKSIDEEDNHILTDRLFTVLKERRSHHRRH